MYALEKAEYGKINSMVDRDTICNAFLSVIDGYNPGTILVDNKATPLIALVWSQGIAGFGVIGQILSASFVKSFMPFVDGVLTPFLQKQGHTCFEVNCINETLNSSFAELISVKSPYQWEQKLYTLDIHDKTNGIHEKRESVHVVNHELLSTSVNTKLIKDTINQYWRSIDEFLLSGIGYCCIKDNIAVSFSYSGFISESYYEIGIETLSDYRRKGYAYAAAYAVLEEIPLRGKIPFWECSADNVASVNTAEKLGFREKLVYTCFGFDI